MKKLLSTRAGRILASMVDGFNSHNVMIYAGYACFMILMSIVPLIMLAITVVNLLPWYSAESLTEMIYQFLPDILQIRIFVGGVLRNLNQQSTGAVASIAAVTSLWSASGGVFAIKKGLTNITPNSRPSPWDRGKAIIYTVFFLVLFAAVLVVQVLGSSITEAAGALTDFLGIPNLFAMVRQILEVSRMILLAVMFLFLLVMYCVLPGGKRSVKGQIPGAVFTTLVWSAFSALFAYFIPRFWKASSIYGSLASVFLVSMWLDYMIVILLLGAELNRALAETSG